MIYTVKHKSENRGNFTVGVDDKESPISGDNSYAEMRCHYWVWKNKPSAIVGFSNHRRRWTDETLVGDIVVPNPFYVGSIRNQFIACHGEELWNALEKVLPIPHMENLLPSCMFITSWDIFDRFMTFWWGLVQRLELPQIPDDLKPSPTRRDIGFLTERIFTVWLSQQNLDVRYRPIEMFKNEQWLPITYPID